MIDGTKFSTWKDFALSVVEELDDLNDKYKTLKIERDADHEKFIEFRTRVYTIAGIVILIVGAIEISVRL